VIRRNHSFLQSLALVMRARMLGVRAQTVKVEACVCKSATKQHLAVAWLHLPNQPNTDLLHVLGLAPTGLALWCDPGSSGKRTNQALVASPEPGSREMADFIASWEPGWEVDLASRRPGSTAQPLVQATKLNEFASRWPGRSKNRQPIRP